MQIDSVHMAKEDIKLLGKSKLGDQYELLVSELDSID
jgi:hypothetical protein